MPGTNGANGLPGSNGANGAKGTAGLTGDAGLPGATVCVFTSDVQDQMLFPHVSICTYEKQSAFSFEFL